MSQLIYTIIYIVIEGLGEAYFVKDIRVKKLFKIVKDYYIIKTHAKDNK